MSLIALAIAAAAAAPAPATEIKVVESRFGPILADGTGLAAYRFDKEQSRKPRCYGACARAWPPVFTTGKPQAGDGARSKLLGTTRRRDGRLQVTYRNRPLYYYIGDSPGNVYCHNVFEYDGLWQVVGASGRVVS